MKIRDRSGPVTITCGEREPVVLTIYGSFDLKQVVRLSGIRPRMMRSAAVIVP